MRKESRRMMINFSSYYHVYYSVLKLHNYLTRFSILLYTSFQIGGFRHGYKQEEKVMFFAVWLRNSAYFGGLSIPDSPEVEKHHRMFRVFFIPTDSKNFTALRPRRRIQAWIVQIGRKGHVSFSYQREYPPCPHSSTVRRLSLTQVSLVSTPIKSIVV